MNAIAGRTLQTGWAVRITFSGRTVAGKVWIASPNGRSAVLVFEALLGGYAGTMPIAQLDDGSFRDLITDRPVTVEPVNGWA